MNNYLADERQKNLYKKFPSTHYLSNPNNVLHVLAWCTFWRRNLHRFALDYLKLKLYDYQILALYMMGINKMICIIASRNDAKSFIIALYACCICILYPGTKFRIGASTEKQAKLMVSEKIIDELCRWSPNLKKEIVDYSTRSNDIFVEFASGSKITVFVANENARGLRANAICREEMRQIKEKVEDSIIAPFQTPRNQPYMLVDYYSKIPELQEEPIDIYISSSWIEDGNWMWKIVDNSSENIRKNIKTDSVFLCFDEAIALKHGLKTLKQMLRMKKKLDPVTWKTEILNLKVSDGMSSYFTYKMLMDRQKLKQVFYPMNHFDFISKKKNKYQIPKLDNEIRVVSNDIAFVAGSKNDNSVYSCIRAIPESMTYEQDNNSLIVEQGYRRQYPYIESNQMGDTNLQAVRIRQLYEDFSADYIVLDTRNGGLNILYALQKPLYDSQRKVEYKPLMCMNNKEYAKVCQDPNAKECIFAINATQALNSDIAIAFRKNLVENKIDFLVNYNTAQEEIFNTIKDYSSSVISGDSDAQVQYEMPFLETQFMINECAELQYEKMQQTGLIKISEKGSNRKDRYTSVSYGSYFIDQLELDMFSKTKEQDYSHTPMTVSALNY